MNSNVQSADWSEMSGACPNKEIQKEGAVIWTIGEQLVAGPCRTLHVHATFSHQESKAFVSVGHVLAQTWNIHLVPGLD